ncbi:MAG: metal-dependent hydrolase [Gemmatimonadota bacterium]
MASFPTHMILGAALGTGIAQPPQRGRVLLLGAACAALPDLDAIGYWLGVPYGSLFGHRGFTHSLVFAVLLATVSVVAVGRRGIGGTSAPWLWAYLFVATASHGLLDAMTDGGMGVAFFAPFSTERYFLPWRPIAVSPIGIQRFFSARGVMILASEAVWVWLPAGVIAWVGTVVRRECRVERRGSRV